MSQTTLQGKLDRRQFIGGAAAVAGGLLLPGVSAAAEEKVVKRTAGDKVALGKTGLKPSRLGIGTGSRGGSVQRRLGREGFVKLLRYAYDHGITYIDTAQSYRIHPWVGEAIKGLPREKLYIQSKIWGLPDKPLEVLDRFRRELGVDYIDTVLTHCAVRKSWVEDRKRVLDALAEAKAKKIIRAVGVSCHGLVPLARTPELDWLDVVLVRINPQGVAIDTPEQHGRVYGSNASHVPLVMKQIKRLHQRRRGIIGMKLIGNGDFRKPEDREKSIRFAMQCGLLDAAVIGFKSPAEIDEAIERINRALAEAPAARTA